jgi:hypothetical protein
MVTALERVEAVKQLIVVQPVCNVPIAVPNARASTSDIARLSERPENLHPRRRVDHHASTLVTSACACRVTNIVSKKATKYCLAWPALTMVMIDLPRMPVLVQHDRRSDWRRVIIALANKRIPGTIKERTSEVGRARRRVDVSAPTTTLVARAIKPAQGGHIGIVVVKINTALAHRMATHRSLEGISERVESAVVNGLKVRFCTVPQVCRAYPRP